MYYHNKTTNTQTNTGTNLGANACPNIDPNPKAHACTNPGCRTHRLAT